MIIVKTTNGDQFINETAVSRVEHCKDTHTVNIYKGTVGTFQYAEHTIEHVEGICYSNESQPTNWSDEGSLIKKLQGIIDQQKHELGFLNEMVKRLQSDLRHYSSNIIQVINYRKDGEMSDETANAPYEKEHPDSKTAETALIGELNEQLESSFASIRRIEAQLKEAVRMKEAYKRGSEKLYARTLWQRILNKKVEL